MLWISSARVSTLLREIYDPPIVLYLREEVGSGVAAAAIVGQAADGLWHNCADVSQRTLRHAAWPSRPSGPEARRGCAPRGVAGGHTYAVFGSGLDFVYQRKIANSPTS